MCVRASVRAIALPDYILLLLIGVRVFTCVCIFVFVCMFVCVCMFVGVYVHMCVQNSAFE